MKKTNNKRILFGLYFVRLIFVTAVIAFYFYEIKPRIDNYTKHEGLKEQKEAIESMASALIEDQKKNRRKI